VPRQTENDDDSDTTSTNIRPLAIRFTQAFHCPLDGRVCSGNRRRLLGDEPVSHGDLRTQNQYAAQYWQSVQRKEAIKAAPIARRRTSILALTAAFGLVLIVTGGTLGYRWTYPHTLGLDAYEHAQCTAMGYQRGTPLYLQCRSMVAQARLAGQADALQASSISIIGLPTVHIISDAARPMCSRPLAGCK
jgi:hypothetical protein